MTAGNDTIGIWKAEVREDGLFYVRDRDFYGDWKLWAGRNEIGPKNNRRVVLLGESVARGYLYDPHYTPAMVLEHLLNQQEPEGFEVIDLARTNMKLGEIENICLASLKLNPDAIIFFAGNNWMFDLYNSLSEPEIMEVIERLNARDGSGALRMLENKLSGMIKAVFDRIFTAAEAHNVQFFFLVPEFNLKDWMSVNPDMYPSFVSEEVAAGWKDITREAGHAKGEKLLSLGTALIRLDPVNPYGYMLTAEAYLQEGNEAMARLWLEKARDISILTDFFDKPKIPGIVQQAIHEIGLQAGVPVISLRDVFWKYTGKIPGRRLFLDYCHLTAEGIQIAMAATARVVLFAMTGVSLETGTLISAAATFMPAGLISARAHLFAAIHTAHYGQRSDLLQYHCEQAMAADAEVADMMVAFAEMASLKAPNKLCRQFEELLVNMGIHQYDGGFDHEPGKKLMDVALVDAIVTVLPVCRERVAIIRQQEHGLRKDRKINLLESFYAMQGYKHTTGHNYYRCQQGNADFFLVADAGMPVSLKLVCRVFAGRNDRKKVRVSVNRTEIFAFEANTSWQRTDIPVPPELITAGVNRITVSWPDAIQELMLDEKHASFADIIRFINPFRGEIHRFEASAAG